MVYRIDEKISYQSAVDRLKDNNYYRIGEGSYGEIYSRTGEPFVLKLFQRNDKAYILFVNFCLANLGDKHLPKFKGKLINLNSDFCAIRIEILSEYPYGQHSVTLNYLYDYFDYALRGLSASYIVNKLKYDYEDYDEYVIKSNEDITTTLFKLASYTNEHSGRFKNDLLNNNIMRRNNVLVITDPLMMYNRI